MNQITEEHLKGGEGHGGGHSNVKGVSGSSKNSRN